MTLKQIFFFIVAFICSSGLLLGQITIKGTLKNEEGNPLEGATVFFNNTSLGTTTNKNGQFELAIPVESGTYNLVISFVGYETFKQQLVFPILQLEPLTVTLLPRPGKLPNVIVKPHEKGDWNTWGKLFSDLFLGIMPESGGCKMLNYNSLEFKYYSKGDILEVTARKPLIIINKALGYQIDYILEAFEYSGISQKVHFVGYSKFTELKPNNLKVQNNWEDARKRVYYGSQMHFMRALFANRLQQEGFLVKREKRVPEPLEKHNPDEAATTLKDLIPNGSSDFSGNKLIATLPENIRPLQEDNYSLKTIALLKNDVQITADSLVIPQNEWQKLLYFPDLINVTYTGGFAEKSYLNLLGVNPKEKIKPASWLEIVEGKTIIVEASGAYFSPTDIFSFGYWAWRERMATMLPIDYLPPSK